MDIKNSIVAILNSRDKIVGTGFLASQNLVVTCAHVIVAAGTIDGNTVQVRFHGRTEKLNALVVPEYWRDVDNGDVAVLRLENVPDGVMPLPLGNAAGSAGHDFYAYGYAIVTDVQGIGARGKIVDIVANGHLVQLTSQEPDHGMSGGPVLDEQRRVVIGMVTKGKGLLEKGRNLRNTQTTFATSVEVIREACSELRLTEICPYRSLDVFNEEDAPFFFGREKLVQKLLDSLKREPRFLAVLGPSGSGKSSVVRAGLIPALRQGKVPGSQKWEIVTIRPANDPFEQLGGAGFIIPQAGLEGSVKTWLADRPNKTRLTLFIDQFEEVLISAPKDIQQKFVTDLTQLLDAPLAITVVITLRDDFYSRFLHDATSLISWLERGLVNIPPVLEQDDLRAMVVEPAKSLGLAFDDGLVDVIIADACETDRSKDLARSTILPLLEFALTELWEKRSEEKLTHTTYNFLGGVAGGLAQWADKVFYEFSPEDRKTAQQVICRLVHLGDNSLDVPAYRVIERRKTLGRDRYEQVIAKLADARLLITGYDNLKQEYTLEIIHEALISEWQLLKEWLIQNRTFLSWLESLKVAMLKWEENARQEGALLQGLPLAEAENWLASRPEEIGTNEKEFIQASLVQKGKIQAEKNKLFEDLQRSTLELQLAYDETIEGWSRAFDIRDRETEGHTTRVTELTMLFAQTLGISDDNLINIRRGALLHDIGKIGIPDSIILKPGPLTEQEWIVMRRHPVYAYEMLNAIGYLRPALDIPYCHHERWDGSGYPRGLNGTQIPLAARIFALVDVYNAMISDRPYRRAYEKVHVLEYIRNQQGTFFDPENAKVFIRLMESGPSF